MINKKYIELPHDGIVICLLLGQVAENEYKILYKDRIAYAFKCHKSDGKETWGMIFEYADCRCWAIYDGYSTYLSYQNHREDGPAVISQKGLEEYWINGYHCSSKDEYVDRRNNYLKPIL